MQPSSLPLIKIQHVTPENVIIYCDALGESLVATEVHVKTEHSNLSDRFDDLPLLMQQDLCFALGKILFDIFSEGASFRLFLDDSAFISDDNRWHDDEAVGADADIDRAAQALAAFREAGGLPWDQKMEIARENWRRAVRVVIEALERKS